MGQKLLYAIEALILTLLMLPLLPHRLLQASDFERCRPTYWSAANPSSDGPLSAILSDASEKETLSDGRAFLARSRHDSAMQRVLRSDAARRSDESDDPMSASENESESELYPYSCRRRGERGDPTSESENDPFPCGCRRRSARPTNRWSRFLSKGLREDRLGRVPKHDLPAFFQ